MVALRLPVIIEQKLDFLCETQHKTKTQLIKEAIDGLFYKIENEQTSSEIGEKYFGNYGSGDGTLSQNYKSKLKEKIRAKNAH